MAAVPSRPEKVRLLFVGESPPASGRFFYHRDSGLYRALRDAFHLADPAIVDANFLDVFERSGCYLLDLCDHPVDRLEPIERRQACRAAEPVLARRIRSLQPETIITLVRSIHPNVERAALRAEWTGGLVSVPYPGRWIQHRKAFWESLAPLLKGILR